MLINLTDGKSHKVTLDGVGGEAYAWYDHKSKRWRVDVAAGQDKGYASVVFGPDSRNATAKMSHLIETLKKNSKKLMDLAQSVEQANDKIEPPEAPKKPRPPKPLEEFE
jgi:hypothetical protein